MTEYDGDCITESLTRLRAQPIIDEARNLVLPHYVKTEGRDKLRIYFPLGRKAMDMPSMRGIHVLCGKEGAVC